MSMAALEEAFVGELVHNTEDYILFAATLQSEAGYTNNNTHGKETIGNALYRGSGTAVPPINSNY